MKKLILASILISFILIPLAVSIDQQANIESSYDWLRHQEFTSVFDASLAVLALNNVDPTSAQLIVGWIQSKQDTVLGCFPSGACTIKDTSLALIVLANEGINSTLGESWLLKQQKPNTEGNLYLQVITDSNATCVISYRPAGAQIPIENEIKVEKGQISSNICPRKSTFFNLGNCLESNLFGKSPSLPFSISCRNLDNAKISITYIQNEAYYIVYSTPSNEIDDLILNMGYFVDYEDTLYANWALKEIGSGTNSITWLKKQFSPGNTRDNALVYAITEQEPYIRNLLTLQNKNTGAFENSPFKTGLACMAFTISNTYGAEAEHARKWLDSMQLKKGDNAGSWSEGKVSDTAMVLYGCYSKEAINLPPCTDPKCYTQITKTNETTAAIGEAEECILDSDCPEGKKCDTIAGQCISETPEQCNYNDICEPEYGEDEFTCPLDCPKEAPSIVTEETCGNGFCGVGENESNCPKDCKQVEEEKAGFPWFIVITLLIVLFSAATYYFLIFKQGKSLSGIFKFLKKERRQPVRPEIISRQYQQMQRRPDYNYRQVQKTPQRKTAVEEELKKSIEEAKKLLKK